MPCRSCGEGRGASRASHKLEGVIAAVTDVSFVEEADSPTGAHDKFPLFGLSREIWEDDVRDTELACFEDKPSQYSAET